MSPLGRELVGGGSGRQRASAVERTERSGLEQIVVVVVARVVVVELRGIMVLCERGRGVFRGNPCSGRLNGPRYVVFGDYRSSIVVRVGPSWHVQESNAKNGRSSGQFVS